MSVRMRGAGATIRGFNRAVSKIQHRTEKGLLAAALYLEGEVKPEVPEKHGVLVNSMFTDSATFNGHPIARVGFTAKYAPYVHEMPETNNFTKEGTGPKFLLNPLMQNTNQMLGIIKRRIAV